MHKTYRGLLLEDDVTQELAKKGLELSRTINQQTSTVVDQRTYLILVVRKAREKEGGVW